MAKHKLTVEAFNDPPQVTVEGPLQLTVRDDGSVQIDFAGKHVEVERNMSINQRRAPPPSIR